MADRLGQTLAFVLPAHDRYAIRWPWLPGSHCLPTRELTLQTLHTVQQMAGMKPKRKAIAEHCARAWDANAATHERAEAASARHCHRDTAVVGRLLKEGALRLNRDPKNVLSSSTRWGRCWRTSGGPT